MGAVSMREAEAPPLPFNLVPGRRQKLPIRPITGDAGFSRNGQYRYWLVRRWMASEPPIMWTVLFPSKADGRRDDAAIRRMMAWSHRWGYGSMLVVSLYPFCAANQAELLAWRDSGRRGQQIAQGAIEAGQMVRTLRCQTRVAAWGRLDATGREDLDRWLDALGTKAPNKCLGISDSGDPLHPSARGSSRVEEAAELVSFSYPVGITGRF